jgi:hypothetical protein
LPNLCRKEVALQRAEQKVATVEARFDEYKKATRGDRALFKEKIAKLTEQLDAESAARLFVEGALRSARQERGARRQEGHDVPAESPSAKTESADSKITWFETLGAFGQTPFPLPPCTSRPGRQLAPTRVQSLGVKISKAAWQTLSAAKVLQSKSAHSCPLAAFGRRRCLTFPRSPTAVLDQPGAPARMQSVRWGALAT